MKLYRVKVVNYEEDYRPQFIFEEFEVISETEKTYTIQTTGYNKVQRNYFPVKHRILKNQDGKRFAYATKENAIKALVFKRNRYKSILNWQLEKNDLVIDIAKKMMEDINYVHDFGGW